MKKSLGGIRFFVGRNPKEPGFKTLPFLYVPLLPSLPPLSNRFPALIFQKERVLLFLSLLSVVRVHPANQEYWTQ